MIKLTRPPLDPNCKLARRGDAATDALTERWRDSPADFSAEIDGKLYGSVKDALKAMQHDKCCFCESTFTNTGYGDVEHFRPKKGVEGVPQHRGYWWLAYSWDNLLFCCKRCNVGHKREHFPLRDPATRAMSPDDPIDAESPLIIDPTRVDPSVHIGWRAEVPFPLTEEGDATITCAGLHREGLSNERAKRYKILKRLYQTLELLAAERARERDDLTEEREARWQSQWDELHEALLHPREAYLAMSRAAFRAHFNLI